MPGAHSKRATQPVSPRAEEKSKRRAAFPQAHVLERGDLVHCRDDQRTDRYGSAGVIPREDAPGEPAFSAAYATSPDAVQTAK